VLLDKYTAQKKINASFTKSALGALEWRERQQKVGGCLDTVVFEGKDRKG